MKYLPALVLAALLLASCSKAKETIGKTGDAVGQSSAIFFHSVVDGVDKTLECSVNVSPALADKGLGLGNDKVSSFSTAGRNVLTVYIIFNQDFNETVTVKIFNSQGNEYGRVAQTVTGKKGEAKNVDFKFDERTTIETKSRFDLE